MEENHDSIQSKENNTVTVPSLDTFLYVLSTTVVKHGFGFGITLNVKGTIVSGILITEEEYFKGITQETANADNGELFAQVLSEIDNFMKEATPEKKILLSKFIHLKNAKYFFSGADPIPSNRGIYWRGRLSEVDGFSFGNLSPQTD